MNKETAKEILKNQYEKTYATLYKQSVLGSTYEKLVIEAMIEFAKNKCKEQREISWKLFQSSEIDGKKITLDAPTPDFK